MTNPSSAPTGEQKSFRTYHRLLRRRNKRLQGLTFYPLIADEWLDTSKKLSSAELRVLYYLRLSVPFGDRPIEVGVRDLARSVELGASTVSRVLRKLAEFEYIELSSGLSTFRIFSKGIHVTLLDELLNEELEEIEGLEPLASAQIQSAQIQSAQFIAPTIVSNEEPQLLGESHSVVLPEGTSVPVLEHLCQERNTHPLEFKPGQGFGSLKTNQILNTKERETKKEISPDLEIPSQQTTNESQPSVSGWQNFVAPGGDPEFFAFVVRRTAKLPQPPADAQCAAEGWIRKQGHVLYPQYVAWKSRQTILAEPAPTSAPPATEPLEMTLAERLAKYQSMWQIPVCRKGIKAAIAAHPEWGLQIGKAGPEIIGEKVAIAG